jgi:two-component system response regulator FixJ
LRILFGAHPIAGNAIRYGAIADAFALSRTLPCGQHRHVTGTGGHIHLILPDPVERAACFRLLAAGCARVVRGFASGDDWLAAGARESCAVLLLRWEQPGAADGAALLGHATEREGIVALVAAERLSIAESRAILLGGARDLLPAPLDPRLVRRTIDAALAERMAWQAARERQRAAAARLAALTPRERDILDGIAAGLGNKAIARRLDLSPRTVEVHRANIMRRAGAGNVAELLHLRFVADAAPGNRSISAHDRGAHPATSCRDAL